MTPFEAVYGSPPPHPTSYVKGITRVQAVDDQLKSRDQITKLLKENLEEAQQRMKHQADLHRTECSFEEGNWVYLRLQHYRQNSVTVVSLVVDSKGPTKSYSR